MHPRRNRKGVMLMKLQLIGVLAVVGALAACGTPSMEHLAKDQAKAEALRADARDAQVERQQAKNEAVLDQIPKWALQAPTPDATGIFAVGVGKSADLRTAMRKAVLDAEFGLAKNYNQEISGSERSFNQEAGSAINTQYTELIDKLVTQVPVVGLETVKQEVKSIGGEFHSFVLVKMPYAEFNKVLTQQRNKAQEATVEAAFVALEKRVKARQEERAKELAASNPAN